MIRAFTWALFPDLEVLSLRDALYQNLVVRFFLQKCIILIWPFFKIKTEKLNNETAKNRVSVKEH